MRPAPGSELLNVFRWLFKKAAVEGIFEQAVADMREEYFEALSSGRYKKARWILIRDHINLVITALLYIATSVGKKLVTIWKIIP